MEFQFEVLTADTCAITSVSKLGSSGLMEIPSTMKDAGGKNYKVVSVCCYPVAGEDRHSEEYEGIRKVVVPEGVTEIADDAFSSPDYYRLNTAILPSTLEKIGNFAFVNCWLKRGIVLPKHLKQLGHNAFERCKELREIVIPEGVTRIPSHAFLKCGKLQSVTLPSTLEVIEPYAFEECPSLLELDIPASVNTIGDAAFCGDFNIKLNLPPTLKVDMNKLIYPEWMDKI